MSLADHVADDDPDPPPSPWRWVVALTLAGLTLGVGMLVRRENDRAAALKKAAESPVATPHVPARIPSGPAATIAAPPDASHPGAASTSATPAPASTEARVALADVRLDAHVDVIHKHGMGSCEGRLVATPAGLRYETSRASDAFSVPLDRLERLDVDYRKKTLTVKPRGGRTFNFTTRAANADPLVAFQNALKKGR